MIWLRIFVPLRMKISTLILLLLPFSNSRHHQELVHHDSRLLLCCAFWPEISDFSKKLGFQLRGVQPWSLK